MDMCRRSNLDALGVVKALEEDASHALWGDYTGGDHGSVGGDVRTSRHHLQTEKGR